MAILLIDLKTTYRSGVDFVRVDTTVYDPRVSKPRYGTRRTTPGDDFEAGERVLDLSGIRRRRTYTVVVVLLDEKGAPIDDEVDLVFVPRNYAHTVRILRR